MKIAANGSNLEFHDRGVAISDAIFFPPSHNITPALLAVVEEYCCDSELFVLKKVSK